jgi:hypothetical protein
LGQPPTTCTKIIEGLNKSSDDRIQRLGAEEKLTHRQAEAGEYSTGNATFSPALAAVRQLRSQRLWLRSK